MSEKASKASQYLHEALDLPALPPWSNGFDMGSTVEFGDTPNQSV